VIHSGGVVVSDKTHRGLYMLLQRIVTPWRLSLVCPTLVPHVSVLVLCHRTVARHPSLAYLFCVFPFTQAINFELQLVYMYIVNLRLGLYRLALFACEC